MGARFLFASPARLVCALMPVLMLAACDDDAIRVYEVAATTRQAGPATPATTPATGTDVIPPAPQGASPTTAPGDAAVDAAHSHDPWSAPAHWRRVPGDRPMRVATYAAERDGQTMEIVVSRFPGDVGGLLANVNRWRQQVGLAPLQESELDAQLTPFQTARMSGHTMWLKGQTQQMLAAIIADPAGDQTWFVKATGPADAAAAHQADVDAFARTFGAAAEHDHAAH